MKIQKSFITVLCIVLLTALTLCPVQSEAASYGSIVVTASGFTVDGGLSQPLGNLPLYLTNSDTIGILTFGTGIVFPAPPLTVGADITNILIVDAGTEITLAGTASTTGANVTVDGTLNGNVATGAGFVKVNSGGIINGKVGNASMTGNVTVYDSASINSAGGTPSIRTTGSVNLLGGDVLDRKIVDASSVTTSNGTNIQSTGFYAIDNTSGNVKVNDSTLSALEIAINATGGNVTVTDSTVSAGNYGISGTSGDVTVTGATSEISGGQGGIKDTGGSVEIGKKVTVNGGTGAAISNTDGTVAVGSPTDGAIITGAEGIINTGGDLFVTKSQITGTNGDGIRGVLGDVDISKSTITASEVGISVDGANGVKIDNVIVNSGGAGINATNTGTGGVIITDTIVTAGAGNGFNSGIDASGSAGVVNITNTKVTTGIDRNGITISGSSVDGNVINNLDITAGENGLIVSDTKDLTVNLTKTGSISADVRGIWLQGYNANTMLTIDSPNGSSLDITAGHIGIEVDGGATLNNNVETAIANSGSGGSSTYGYGVFVRSGGSANFNEALTVETSGSDSYGILVIDGGKFNAAKGVVINSGGSGSTGIVASDEDSEATIDGLTSINMNGNDSTGVSAASRGTVNLNGGLELDATGAGEMKGLFANDEANIYVNGGYINVHSTGAGDAYGAIASGDSLITFENFGDITVQADAGNAYGLYADPSTITGDVTNITVTATGDAYGAFAFDSSIIDAEVSDKIDVKSTGIGAAIGIGSRKNSETKIRGLDELVVSSNDGNAFGIRAVRASSTDVLMDDGTVMVTSALEDASGVQARDSSYVNISGIKELEVSAATKDAYGLRSNLNSNVTGDVGKITVTAAGDAYGVHANDSSTIDVDVNKKIEVKSTGAGKAVGIGAETNSDVTISGLNNLIVAATSGDATGIKASDNSQTHVSMTKDITVGTELGNAYGVAAEVGSRVDLTGAKAMEVSATSGDAYGLFASNIGVISADVKSIKATAGANAYGAIAENGSEMDLLMAGAMVVKSTETGEAIGIGAGGDSNVTVRGLGNLRVEATDGRAIGIGADSDGTADVSMDGNITVETAFGKAHGAAASNASHVYLTGAKSMTVSAISGDAFGVNAYNGSTLSADIQSIEVTAGERAYGAVAELDSEMDLLMAGAMVVKSTGTGEAVGIGAQTSGDVTVKGLTDLTVTATDGRTIGIGAEITSLADVSMDGNITVGTLNGEAQGVRAVGGSTVNLTGAKAMVVSATSGDAFGLLAWNTDSVISADVESITSTASGSAFGIAAAYEGKIQAVLSGDVIVESTTVGEAVGIGAHKGDVVVTGLEDLFVTAVSGDVVGIGADLGGHTNVAMTGTMSVLTDNGTAKGILAEDNSDTTVRMDLDKSNNDIFVHSKNGNAYGAVASGDSDIVFENVRNLVVSADAGDAYGLFANDPSTISGDVESITVTASGNAYGAYAYSLSSINSVMSGDITVTSTAAGEAVGIGAEDHSDVTITGLKNLTVAATSGDAYGIDAFDYGVVNVAMDGNITVRTVSGDAYGAVAEDGSEIDLLLNGKIVVKSTETGEAIGIGAGNNSDVKVSGLSKLKVLATDGRAIGIGADNVSSADVSMDGKITVRTESGNAYGVAASDTSNVYLTGAKTMVVSALGGDAFGVNAYNGSIVSADVRKIEVTADLDAYGVVAENGSEIDLLMAKSIAVDSNITGEAIGIGALANSDVMVKGLTDLSVSAVNGRAIGIGADDDSKADVEMSGVITVGTSISGNAYGILSDRGSEVSVDVESITSTANDFAYGIAADRGGEINVILSGDVTAQSTSTTGAAAVGIGADRGGDVTVSGLQNLSATANVGEAMGIGADRGGDINTSMSGNITVDNLTFGKATGIGANRGGDVIVDGLKNMHVTAKEGNAAGLAADNGGNINVIMSGDITVETANGYGYGVFADGNSEVYFTGAKAMVVSADVEDAYGLYAFEGIISGDVESITVTADDGAYGVYAEKGSVISGDIHSIVATSNLDDAYGIVADTGSEVTIAGLEELSVTSLTQYASGIIASKGGDVNVAMDSDITVTGGTDADGVIAEMGGEVTVTGLHNLTVTANNGYANGVVANKGGDVDLTLTPDGSISVTGTGTVRGLKAETGGSISMTNGDLAINQTGDSAYMQVNKHGSIYLNNVTANVDTAKENALDETRTLIITDSNGVVSADLGTVIAGNIIHTGANDGSLDIYITGGSKIIGAANSTANDDARINITTNSLADRDTWEVTAYSYTNGTLTNRGIVDYQKVESLLDYNDGTELGDFKMVHVYKFMGNSSSTLEDDRGILEMKADINAGDNDYLLAEDSATGTNRLEIQNLTNSGVARSGTLVAVKDDTTDLELSIANPDGYNALGQGLVDAGAWNYVLADETYSDSKEWFLERYSLTSTGQGIVSSIVNADTWYKEVDTLLNRMGIYRDGNYYGGVWFEAAANKHEIDGGFGSQYDQQFTNFTLGWDKMYAKEKGDLFLGIMGGYGKADRDIGSIGESDFESTHAALYGIYRTHDGFYATGLVKYNQYDNDMSLFGVDKFSQKLLAELGEDRVRSNWDQDGYGVSLQIGKRMDRDNGWYFEPQAQLSWMRINGDGYRTNTGINVDIDDSDSFRGRLGLLVGRSIQLKGDAKLDVFGSLSLVHEFDGETDITMDGGKWTSDLSGTWGVFGAGFNWNFQPGKYVHGGVSYATGDNRDEPWGVYLGLSIELGGGKSAREKVETALKEAEAETEAETEAEPVL